MSLPMMFLRRDSGPLLAISQPAHAFVSGQLLRAWAKPLDQSLLLAAALHDLAWLDWERSPTFDGTTNLPKRFLDVGAAEHAPRWSNAVDQALAAWGMHVALLISRHGGLIYTRFAGRHQAADADKAAAAAFLADQAPKEAGWARMLGIDGTVLARESDLIALADTLSLCLCGGLPLPQRLTGPGPDGNSWQYAVDGATSDDACTLTPWPFAGESVTIDIDAMPIANGRFADEADMRGWLAAGARVPLRLRLVKGADPGSDRP